MEVMIGIDDKTKRQAAKRRSHFKEQVFSEERNKWTSLDVMDSEDNPNLPDWDIPSPEIGLPQKNEDDEVFRWEDFRRRSRNILSLKMNQNFLIFLEECLETLRSTTEPDRRLPDVNQMITSITHLRQHAAERDTLEVKKKLRQIMARYLFMEIEWLGTINCENIGLRVEELIRSIVYRIKIVLITRREVLYTFVRISHCVGNNLQKSAVQEYVVGNLFSSFLSKMDMDVSNIKQYTLCLLCYRLWRDLSLKRETKERIRLEAVRKLQPPLFKYCTEKRKFLQCMLLSKISRSANLDGLMSKLTLMVMTKNNIAVKEIYGKVATFFRENNKYHDRICGCEIICINDEPIIYSECEVLSTEAKTKDHVTKNEKEKENNLVNTSIILSDDDCSDNATVQPARSKSSRRRTFNSEISRRNGDNTNLSKSVNIDVDFNDSEQAQLDIDTAPSACSTPKRRPELKRPKEITNSECNNFGDCIEKTREIRNTTEAVRHLSLKERDNQLPNVSDNSEKEPENIISVDTERSDTLENTRNMPNADSELRIENSEIEIDSTYKNSNEKEQNDTESCSLEVNNCLSSETNQVIETSEINTVIKSTHRVNTEMETKSDVKNAEVAQEKSIENTNSKVHLNDCEQESSITTVSVASTENEKHIFGSNTQLGNKADQQRVNATKSCNSNVISQSEPKLVSEGDLNTKQLLEITTDQVPTIVNAEEPVTKDAEMNIIENFFNSEHNEITQKFTVPSENMKKDAQTILTENTQKSTTDSLTINNSEIESRENNSNVNKVKNLTEKELTEKTEVAQDLQMKSEKLRCRSELRPEIEKKLSCKNYDSQNSDFNLEPQKKVFKDNVQESNISEEFEKENSVLLTTQDDLLNENRKLHKKHKKSGSSLNCRQEENSLTPKMTAVNKETSQDSVKIIERKKHKTVSLDTAGNNKIKSIDNAKNTNKVSNNFTVEIAQDSSNSDSSKIKQKNEFIDNMQVTHPEDCENNAENETTILDSSIESSVEKRIENCNFLSPSQTNDNFDSDRDNTIIDASSKEIMEQSSKISEICVQIQSKDSNLLVNDGLEKLNKQSDINFDSEDINHSDSTVTEASSNEIMEQSASPCINTETCLQIQSTEPNLVVSNESEKISNLSESDVNFESDNTVIDVSHKEIVQQSMPACKNSEESNLLMNDESEKFNRPSVSDMNFESEDVVMKDSDSTAIEASCEEITEQSISARKNSEKCVRSQPEESNLTVNYESEKLNRPHFSKRKSFTMLSSDTKEKYKPARDSDRHIKNRLNKYTIKSAMHSVREHDMPSKPADSIERKSCGFRIDDILKSANNKADYFVKTIDDKQKSKRKCYSKSSKPNLKSLEDTNEIKQMPFEENPQIVKSCETNDSETSVLTKDVDNTISEKTHLLKENHSDENLSAKYNCRYNSITENCENFKTNYESWDNLKPAHCKEFSKSVIRNNSDLLPVDLSLECSKKNVSSEHIFLADAKDVKQLKDLSPSKDEVPAKSREQEGLFLIRQSDELINYSDATPNETVNLKSASNLQNEILDNNSNVSSKIASDLKTSSVCNSAEVKFVMNEPQTRKSSSDMSKKSNSNLQVEFRTNTKNNNEQTKVILSPNKSDSKWWKDPPKKRVSTDNQISNDDKHDDRLDSLISQLEKRVEPSTKLLDFVNIAIALRNSNEKPDNEKTKNNLTTETKMDTSNCNEVPYYDYNNDYNHKYPPKVQKYMDKKNKNFKKSENTEQCYNTQSQTKISEENSTALEFVLVDNPIIETESTQTHCDQKSEDPLSINVEANVTVADCESICIVPSGGDNSAVLPRKNRCKKRKSIDHNTETQNPEKRPKLDTNYKKPVDMPVVWSDKSEKKKKKREKHVKFNDELAYSESSTSIDVTSKLNDAPKKKKSEYPKNEKLRQKRPTDMETEFPKKIKYQNYSDVIISSNREKTEKSKKKQLTNEKIDFRKKEKSECQNYSDIIIPSKREKLVIPNQKQSIEVDSPKKAKFDDKKETIQTQANTSFEYPNDESSTSKKLLENSYDKNHLLSFEYCGKLKAKPVTEDCNIIEEVQAYKGENTKPSKKRDENKQKYSHINRRDGNIKKEAGMIPKTNNLKSPHCEKYSNSEQTSIDTKKSSSKNFQQCKNTEKTISSKSKSQHIKNDVKLCAEKTSEINSKLNSCSRKAEIANLEKTTKINSNSNFYEDKKNLTDFIDNDRKPKSVSKTTYPEEKSTVELKDVQIKSKSNPCNRDVNVEISKNAKSCRKSKSDKDNSNSRNSNSKEKVTENNLKLNFQHKKSKLEKLVDGISKSNFVGEKDASTNAEKIINEKDSRLVDRRTEPTSKSHFRIEEPNTDTKTENIKTTNSASLLVQPSLNISINKEKKTKYVQSDDINVEKLNTEQVSRTHLELDSNRKEVRAKDEKITQISNFNFEQHKSDAKCSDKRNTFNDSGQIKRKRSLDIDTKTRPADGKVKIPTDIGTDRDLNVEDSSYGDKQCHKQQLLSMPIIDLDGDWNTPTNTVTNIVKSASAESFLKSMPAINDTDEIKNKRKSEITPINVNAAKNSNVSKNENVLKNTCIKKFDPQKIKNPISMSSKRTTVKKKIKIESSEHLTPITTEKIFEDRCHIDNSSESLKPTNKNECKPEIEISERLSPSVRTEKTFQNQFHIDNSGDSLIEADKIDQLISEDMQNNCNIATDNKQETNENYPVLDHSTTVNNLKDQLVCNNSNDIPQISTYQVFESYNVQNNLNIGNKNDHLGIEILNEVKSECANLNENVDIPNWLKENISTNKKSNEEHFSNIKNDDVQLHKLDHQFSDILPNKEHFKIDSQMNLLPTNQHLDLHEPSLNNALEIHHTNSIFGNNLEHAYADTINQNPGMIIVDGTFCFDIAREETFRDTINPLQNGDFFSRTHENNVQINPEVDELSCLYYTDSQLTDHDNFEHVYDSEKWVSPRAIDGSQFKGALEFPSCISALAQDTFITNESPEIPLPVETINSASDINSEQKYGSKDQLLSATPICYKNENIIYDIEIPFDEEKTTELTKKSTLPAHDSAQAKYDTPPVICKGSQNTSSAELQTQNSVIQIPNVPADVSSMPHFGDCDAQPLEQLILNELETHTVGQDKAHHVNRFETQTTIPQQILQDPRIRNNEQNRQHLSKAFCNSKEVQTKQICRVRPYFPLGTDKKNKNEPDFETTERESQVYKSRENKNSRREVHDIFDKVKNSSPKNLPLPLRSNWLYEDRLIMNKRRTNSSNADDKSLDWRKQMPLEDNNLF